MSKSIDEMIDGYIDRFISSPDNRLTVHLALLKEMQQSAEYFYAFYTRNPEVGFSLEELLNLSDYSSVTDEYRNSFCRANEIFYRCFDDDIFISDDSCLNRLLYIFIKLDECADELLLLQATLGKKIFFADCEDLVEVKNKIETLNIVLEKFDPKDTMIDFVDIVVKTNVFKCNKNHSIEQIQAKVNVVDYFGDVAELTVPAGYCKDCNCYFILEKDFNRLKSYGVILCQIISEKIYRSSNTSNIYDLKAESILHQAGYNVSSAENLSTEQRREILRRVVDFGLYSISGLCSFLDYLIDKNLRVTTRNMSFAISKWQSDRNYIANYNKDEQRQVNVSSFYTTEYDYLDDDEDLPF